MKHCVQATLLCLFAALGCSSAFAKPVPGLADDEMFGDGAAMLRRITIAEAAAAQFNTDIQLSHIDSFNVGPAPPQARSLPAPQLTDVAEPSAVPVAILLSGGNSGIFQARDLVACVGSDCLRARSGWVRPILTGGDHHPLITPEPAPLTLVPVGGLALLLGSMLLGGRLRYKRA